jgi:hypothetical protein
VIAHNDVILDEHVIANVAIFTYGGPRQNMRKGPDLTARAD